jgi:hypothetical protein
VVGRVDDTPFVATDVTLNHGLSLVKLDLAGKRLASGVAIGASADGMHLAQAVAQTPLDGKDALLSFTLGDDALADTPLPAATVGGSGPNLIVDQPLLRLQADPTRPAAADILVSNVGNVPAPLHVTLVAQSSELVASGCDGSTILAGTACKLHIELKPETGGKHVAGAAIIDGGGGDVQTVLIGANELTAPKLTTTTMTTDFGDVAVGKPSDTVTLQITNSGGSDTSALATSITGTDASGVTVVADACNKQTLAVNASCTLQISLNATHTGALDATITVSADHGGSVTLPVHGNGVALLPITLAGSTDFGPVAVGKGSSTQLTVTNVGSQATGPLMLKLPTTTVARTFLSTSPDGDKCTGTSLAPGATCSFYVEFGGDMPGMFSGSLVITDGSGARFMQELKAMVAKQYVTVTFNGKDITQNSGNIILPSGPPPASGTYSDTITITNISDTPLPKVSGPNTTTTCSSTLDPGKSCNFTVTTNNVVQGTAVRDVFELYAGGGVYFSIAKWFSALQLDTVDILVNSLTDHDHADHTVTISNVSTDSVAAPSAMLSGTGANFSITNNCSGTLSPGASCTIVVHPSPSRGFQALIVSAPNEGSFGIDLDAY